LFSALPNVQQADAVAKYRLPLMSKPNDVSNTQKLLSQNKSLKQKYLLVYRSETKLLSDV